MWVGFSYEKDLNQIRKILQQLAAVYVTGGVN